MTAIAARRKRGTVVGAVVALILAVSASVMFVTGVNTLSNSREGQSVGIDDRPRQQFPVTPNALLAVQDATGDLASLAVLTLLPEGQGGSIVPLRVDADATSGFGLDPRPIADEFDPADVELLVATVEEMLSISLQRAALVDADVLESLIEPIGTVRADLATGVDDAEPNGTATGDAVTGDAVTAPAGMQTLTPPRAAAALIAADIDPEAAHANDVAVWEALAAAAPLVTTPEAVPTDDLGRPVAPTTVEELFGRLFEGSVGVRDLALAPVLPASGTDPDAVVIDRRDSAFVFAQVSPALVSTPNPGLKIRVVAPYTLAQLDESDGLFESTTELMVEFIGQMLFLQNNVVSVDTAPSGAAAVTVIEVVDPRVFEQVEESSTAIFGEAEVRLADTLLEGVDIEVTLGMSYVIREMVRAESGGGESVGTSVPGPATATVGGDG